MEQLKIGDRVTVEHPQMGRSYGTFVGDADEPEAVMVEVDGRFYNPQKWPAALVRKAWAARDMVIGDLLNLDMLKEAIEKPFLGTLWTHGDSGMLTPYVCECSFGDGLKLLRIFTINQRPNYHVVRVHSGWDESNWSYDDNVGEHIDDILSAIEDECGRAGQRLDDPCENCGETACKCGDDYSADEAFPELDDRDGCSWAFMDWPKELRR